MRCSVLLRLAAAGGLLLVLSSEAQVGQYERTVQVTAGSNLGIGFDYLPGTEAHNLKLKIQAIDEYTITESQKIDSAGQTLWTPSKISQPGQTHEYNITGIIPNQSHAVRIHGKLAKAPALERRLCLMCT